MAATTKAHLRNCDMTITAPLDVNWWCCWNEFHTVARLFRRVLPAASAKCGSVIGCVVAITAASAFRGSVHGWVSEMRPSPHHQKSCCLPARSPAYDSSPSFGVYREISRERWLTLNVPFLSWLTPSFPCLHIWHLGRTPAKAQRLALPVPPS
jgi:hypothetical protein